MIEAAIRVLRVETTVEDIHGAQVEMILVVTRVVRDVMIGADIHAAHGGMIAAVIHEDQVETTVAAIHVDEVIAAADKHSLAMVFTGVRHFRH